MTSLPAQIGLMAAIVLLWAVPIGRPIDLPSWHEFDTAAIARNFIREPSSIAEPRVDWRKDGPGFVESEFPLHPWLMAQCQRLGGSDVACGRGLSLGAMTGALGAFVLIARFLFPEAVVIPAMLLFGVNRLTAFVATAIQPEAFMLLFYLAAVYGFLRWRADGSATALVATGLATAGAILEKAPAAHIGLYFLFVLLMEEGWSCLRSRANWLLGFLSLSPPVLWYLHAYGLWKTYGNSLGISNEDHWLGSDFGAEAKWLVNVGNLEVLFVFSIAGVLLLALAARPTPDRNVKHVLAWYLAIAIYYVVTLRTTHAQWAWYYHVVSVAPAALLCGWGAARVLGFSVDRRHLLLGGTMALIAMAGLIFVVGRLDVDQTSLGALTRAKLTVFQDLALWFVVLLALFALSWLLAPTRSAATVAPSAAVLCGAGLAGYLYISGHLILGDLALYATPSKELQCAQRFAPLIPPEARILASGGVCTDKSGHKAVPMHRICSIGSIARGSRSAPQIIRLKTYSRQRRAAPATSSPRIWPPISDRSSRAIWRHDTL
jgi:hypothetical protein